MTRASDLGPVAWYGDEEAGPWPFAAVTPRGYETRYRVTGTLTAEPDLEPTLVSVTITRLENDGGAWVGTFHGYAGPEFNREWNVFIGEGGYEGLTAVFTWTGDGSTLEGVIVPGELPQVPDLSLIPVEE